MNYISKYTLLILSFLFSLNSFAEGKNKRLVSGKVDGHSYVDLGLPSKTLWAAYNLGAEQSIEYGQYYAWGETDEKDEYKWRNYKWGNKKLTKYNSDKIYGSVDNKHCLDEEDDAAISNWGPKWSLPSRTQFQELLKWCNWEWVENYAGSGVNGYKGVSQLNKKIIFFPASGYYGNSDFVEEGECAAFWTSTAFDDDSYGAYATQFTSKGSEWKDISRYCGLSVRAVTRKY